MSFNSLQFIALLVLVVLLYWRLRLKGQNRLLLIASYVFYGWWDWRFLILLAATTVVDFGIGIRIEEAGGERSKRAWLISQLAFNLGILAFFKYAGFFVDSAEHVARAIGLGWSSPALTIILPVGISFFVFHEISYAVDIYRGRLDAERRLSTYALFIAYFPLLAAGPIERAWHLLPQLRTERQRPTKEKAYSGIVLIVSGIFKKVVIADTVAKVSNDVFGRTSGRGTIPLAIGAVAFAIQIYCDFAGYTDVARGTSRLLGIEVFRNFESPYLSTNITQFWRTWHISLSSWLHDYLYIPLGGNKGGRFGTYRNLIIVMLLGGLWHGAAWTFVIWGALHGIALAIHRARGAYEPRGTPPSPRWRDIPSILATFTFVTALWVIFRSATIGDAYSFFHSMATGGLFGSNPGAWMADLLLVGGFGTLVLAMDLLDRKRSRLRPLAVWAPAIQGAMLGAALIGILVFSGTPPEPFIYFQF